MNQKQFGIRTISALTLITFALSILTGAPSVAQGVQTGTTPEMATQQATQQAQPPAYPLVISTPPADSARSFRPDETLGAAFDGAEAGAIDQYLTPRNIAAMKSAGLRPLSYRLRTELGIQAWHWNPVGSWSDPAHQQGYWTSSDIPAAPIRLSWGYRLPRRGDTVDNATNDDYSRLTDGDRGSFWKSNPYLDPAVLHDGETHPQWLILRFDHARPVNRAQIDWGAPFATRYAVEYWIGDAEGISGRWQAFPNGVVEQGEGGTAMLALADQPISTRFVRVLLLAGSGTAPEGSSDWRDRMGFAVREVAFGTGKADGTLDDAVVHAPAHDGQTFAHVSSTDPWHRAADRNPDLEQAGIDRIFSGKLGFGLPVMMPTGLLFDTPENEAAELRYIARRHYPVRQIELGEEPDGQYGSPADYGALYLAAVDHLQGIVPGARFGGPSLQSAFTDLYMQTQPTGSWNGEFTAYLKRHQRLGDLGFVTFEYYPFDDICGDIHAKLIGQNALLEAAMHRFDQDGVPAAVPRIISEYGFSAFSGRAMAEMPSALLMAGIAGQWLQLGGNATYMFGYQPNTPINQHQPCAGYGNMMLFMADAAGQAKTAMPSFYTARLLTRHWLQPGHALHRLLGADIVGMPGGEAVAYAVRRPDGRLAVLMINRSPDHPVRLALTRKDNLGAVTPLGGRGTLYSYGPAQYAWRDAGPESHPAFSHPPAQSRLPAGPLIVTLPPDTLAVAVVQDRTPTTAH
ncbi:MAG: hypothetical protein RLZZ08_750 [Pseudomonadota bacterium]